MDDNYRLHTLRRNEVVKANTLIQQSRHSFSTQQQKILLYLISQIRPDQKNFVEQSFDIADFCRVCEISDSGNNYNALKSAILGITNKGFWVKIADKEVTMRWIDRAEISHKNGKITVLLDKKMEPFLLDLHANFTKYSLIYTLTMRSKYSVRLYELLKSYEHMQQPVEFDLEWFKTRVGAEYELWYDIHRKVLSVAVMEINTVSDITVEYRGVKKGRPYVAIKFWVNKKKDWSSQTATERAIYDRLTKKRDRYQAQPMDGQLTLDSEEIQASGRLNIGEVADE